MPNQLRIAERVTQQIDFQLGEDNWFLLHCAVLLQSGERINNSIGMPSKDVLRVAPDPVFKSYWKYIEIFIHITGN